MIDVTARSAQRSASYLLLAALAMLLLNVFINFAGVRWLVHWLLLMRCSLLLLLLLLLLLPAAVPLLLLMLLQAASTE